MCRLTDLGSSVTLSEFSYWTNNSSWVGEFKFWLHIHFYVVTNCYLVM